MTDPSTIAALDDAVDRVVYPLLVGGGMLCFLILLALASCMVIARLTYRRAHVRAAVADPVTYRMPVHERLRLRNRLRLCNEWPRIARLDRRLLRRRTPTSLRMLREIDELCRLHEPKYNGPLLSAYNEILLSLEARDRGLARAQKAGKRPQRADHQRATATRVPTLNVQKDLPEPLTEEAAWLRQTFNELAKAQATAKINMDGRQLGELEGVHRAVKELWTVITELPADLREQPRATGSTPMQDAIAAQNDLAAKLQQIRQEAWAGTGLRLDTLRRYSEALTPAGDLDLTVHHPAHPPK